MGRIDDFLKQGKLIVMDGAMGTELEKRGYNVSDALWSAKFLKENPDAIKQIHKDYMEAGANVVTCCSYQATIPGFMDAGYSEEEAEVLIRKSMEIALLAREEWWQESGKEKGCEYPVIAGDIGPYGAYLADGSEYSGAYDLTKEEYKDFHSKRINILKDAGAEIFAVETCPKLDEAKAVAELLEELDSDFWVSFTVKTPGRISDGTPIKDVVECMNKYSHIKAIGVNCVAPEIVEDIILNLRKESDIPICVYPNSGEVYDGINKVWNGAPDGISFAQRAKKWQIAGARFIGGCCRTSPDDIKEVAKLRDISTNPIIIKAK